MLLSVRLCERYRLSPFVVQFPRKSFRKGWGYAAACAARAARAALGAFRTPGAFWLPSAFWRSAVLATAPIAHTARVARPLGQAQVDADVQPTYVRVVAKKNTLQLLLPAEVTKLDPTSPYPLPYRTLLGC